MAAARPLPYNADAEAAVLGGILLNPRDALNQVVEILEQDDFYVPSNREIFGAMLRLEKLSQPIDVISLEEQLRKHEKLDAVGGPAALAEIASRVPTAENIGYHARLVRDKATLRKLIQGVSEVAHEAMQDPDDVSAFLDTAEQRIFELGQRTTRSSYRAVRQLLLNTFSAIEKRYERKESITGVPTGFPELDKMTGGLQQSDLIIVAARPSMGKTALCLNIAQNAALQYKIPVLIFSLEMSAESLVERLLASEARVESSRIRAGFLDQDDWMKMTRAAGRISEAPIWIDDTAAPTILEVRAKARRFRADKSIFTEEDQMGLVVVDYLQLARGPKGSESREREVAEISRGLKALAKEIKVPVMALSQLRRAAEDRKDGRPQLSDLRESGAIEQDADVIGFIHRPMREDSPERSDQSELIIGKQRNGPVGTIPLLFRGQYTRFESVSREGAAPA
jgi:replicative DNA helicase